MAGRIAGGGVYDLIIVGGGPAGLTAGLYAMRAALKTVLVEKGVAGGQVAITKGVENYPGFENISGFDLSDRMLQHALSYGLEVRQEEVMAIEPGDDLHAVRLGSGEVIRAHAVILALGGMARKLNIPGEAELFGRGVSYCATCDGFFFKGKNVLVVGGGDTAMEEALYLSKIASHVYLIHRSDAFRAGRILQERVRDDPKIQVMVNIVATEIKADEEGVCAVALKDTGTGKEWDLAVDGVFIFVGFFPNNKLVPPGLEIDDRGYVFTDDKCGTPIPGIYIAGDLRRKFANQIVIAAADGSTAALAAAQYVEERKSEPASYHDPFSTGESSSEE